MTTTQIDFIHLNDILGNVIGYLNKNGVITGGADLAFSYIDTLKKSDKNIVITISGGIAKRMLLDKELVTGSDPFFSNDYIAAITLGIHDLNYGLGRVSLFEKFQQNKVLNSNIRLININKPLLQDYKILEINNIKILLAGICDPDNFNHMPLETYESGFLNCVDSMKALKYALEPMKDDIDFAVVLSTQGHEKDMELAKQLPKKYKVKAILGGGSSLCLEAPDIVNDIYVVEGFEGFSNIGHLSLEIDDETKNIVNSSWELVNINSKTIKSTNEDFDLVMDKQIITSFENMKDILCKISDEAYFMDKDHGNGLGNLICDIIARLYSADMVFIPTDEFKLNRISKNISYYKLKAIIPDRLSLISLSIPGKDLYNMINFNYGNTGEQIDFQISKGNTIEVNKDSTVKFYNKFESIKDKRTIYSVILPDYIFKDSEKYFGIDLSNGLYNHHSITSDITMELKSYLPTLTEEIKIDSKSRVKK